MEWLSGDVGNVAAVGKVIDCMAKAVGERESVIALAVSCRGTAKEVERDHTRIGYSGDTGVEETDQNKSDKKRGLHDARATANY
jgi:hypothetical protein